MLGTTMLAIVSLQYYGYGDAGLVGLSVAYALDFTSSLNWSVRSYTEVENSMIQLERVVEYARLPSEAPEVIEDNRPAQSWPEQGTVEFKGYSARYREGLDLVLRDLSFRVLPKQKVGIVGRTGAGKSSLTLALFRIIEAAGGQILIDGEDIAQYGLYDVRSKLSIIPQDPVLFAGTVRENLDPFNSYSDQEIWHALEHAHLADVVRSKDEALEFVVAQGGENFSVGQRQLICLARALLKRAKVLVLDEATAAIDNSTDSIIQESIRKEFKDCTVLTIAHRLNTIIDSDMILVVDGGRLAEYDTPGNLLADETSLFAKLVEESRNNDSQ
ncbi:ATP-binding cassette glutathione S-conjugate transporter ycf1 [Kickxella alabastrina]|nr:ATP-binding cassette glutathione S-conjugate transporter ycf1 [Kickxella alabastrina]